MVNSQNGNYVRLNEKPKKFHITEVSTQILFFMDIFKENTKEVFEHIPYLVYIYVQNVLKGKILFLLFLHQNRQAVLKVL